MVSSMVFCFLGAPRRPFFGADDGDASAALRLLPVVEVDGAGLEPSVLRAEDRVVGMAIDDWVRGMCEKGRVLKFCA